VGVSRQLGYHQHLTGNCLTGAEMQRAVQWTAPAKRPTACGSGGLRLAACTMRPCSKRAARATEPSRGLAPQPGIPNAGWRALRKRHTWIRRDSRPPRKETDQSPRGSLWPVGSAWEPGSRESGARGSRRPRGLRPPRNRQHHHSGRSGIRHRLPGFRGGADRLGHPSAAESDLGPRNSTDAESRRGAQDPVRRRAPGILGW